MRKVVRAGIVAAVAAAVLVAVLLWPGGARSHDVLGRARAAIGDGPVLHVVVQTPSGVQFVALDGHRTVTPTDKVEMWSARNPKRGHVIARERGRVISELLSPEDDHGLGELDPAFAALWTGYQRALADGTAKLVGEDTVYGHRVYWLQFPLPAGVGPGSQVAVDRRTYRAVAFHFGPKDHSIRERVLLARTEPFSASDFRRRTAPPRRPLGARESVGRAVRLGKPWLTAGLSAGRLSLGGAAALTVTSNRRTSHGVELGYGSLSGARWLRIAELKSPPDRSAWLGIPHGFVRIQGTKYRSYDGHIAQHWTGDLVANGIYVTIETSLGRDGLVAAARALKSV